jgi:ferritin-like metal-binding protein YciE
MKGTPMGLFTSDVKTLDDLFLSVLQQIYYAERQIAEQLEIMIGKASAPELKAGFEQHLRETRSQYDRVAEVFRMHGAEAKESQCPAIDGILKAGNSLAGEIADKDVLDAGLTHAAQMVEHYEIAQYGTLTAWAKQLGREDCAQVLHGILEEEKATDEKLTRLAESRLNRQAELHTA